MAKQARMRGHKSASGPAVAPPTEFLIAIDVEGNVGSFLLSEHDDATHHAETDGMGINNIPGTGLVSLVHSNDLLSIDATDEQRYQFLESRSQRDAAEADRLAKKLRDEGRGLPVVCGDDREAMRCELELLRKQIQECECRHNR